ncbi:DUF4142 domain-containing protein [Acetobacter sp.]|uniref:DUF4142 domain-containing protein n=1 Tax=Acetobacter sp. TaxID=440 RepID=UPI0039E76D81
MKTFSKIVAIAALSSVAACATTPPPPPPPPAPVALAATDSSFVQSIAQMNLAETALAKLAVNNSSTAGVRSYAQHIIADHTSEQDRLKTIASAHGMSLPTDPSADDQKTIKTLGEEKGLKFNRAYIANTIDAHKKAIKLAADEATNSTDADLKSFASDFQKTAQAHLESAKKLQGHKEHSGMYRGRRHPHTHPHSQAN